MKHTRRTFCPRCDRVTDWSQTGRGALGCSECDLTEAGRITATEWANYVRSLGECAWMLRGWPLLGGSTVGT